MSEQKLKKTPVFEYAVCMACKDCVAACPVSCLVADKTDVDRYSKAYPRLQSGEQCISCSICAKDCPVDAITMVA
jgi:formate hydrogenlyase subunit 6/NADH:ubiquinone oxidoreductase subunit I